MQEELDLAPCFDTAEQLEMYRDYCATELADGNDIPTFSDFRNMMNE